ncbi:hypothetical protein SeMB42_g03840 [Synchytrium endobioticum]|uniref:Uncharacterized protein n=1 Tax=Synchytrium endobioticum TaxID=286115 RepID=A0A507D422_9FUNG|nr:hypothetical protein SeMB42_g03840 [Synchytrium endobioticum]
MDAFLRPPDMAMATGVAGTVDEAHKLLRLRLDQMGYQRLHLPPDAVQLATRLLSDLIVTTDTARKLKFEKDAAHAETRTLQDQVSPLRQEIARITSENNRLHSDIITAQSLLDQQKQRARQTIRRIESEREDLKFMVSQHQHRAEMEMKKAEAERTKVADMLIKQGIVQDGTHKKDGGSRKVTKAAEKLFSQLQKIDLETGLEPLHNAPIPFLGPDPVIADALRMAEARVEQLSKMKDDLTAKNIDLDNQVQLLREQVARREQESARLGAQLEVARAQQFSTVPPGARPLHEIRGDEPGHSETAGIRDLTVARQRIEQLEMQVEYLQEHVDGLEKELSSYEAGQQTMLAIKEDELQALQLDLNREKERGDGLLKNLNKLEGMLHELQGLKAASPKRHVDFRDENNATTKTRPARSNNREDRSTKGEVPLKMPIRQVAGLTEKLKKAEAELKRVNIQLSSLKIDYEKTSQETEKLRADLAAANAAQAGPRDDAQGVRHSPLKRPATPKRNILPEVEADSQILDDLDDISEQIRRDPPAPVEAMPISSKLQAENRELLEKIQKLEKQKTQFEADIEAMHRELVLAKRKTSEADSKQSTIESLERQVAAKQDEVKQLTQKMDDADSRGASAIAVQDKLIAELEQVKKERDELVKSLEQFESHLADVHRTFDALSAERDNIGKLYEQATEELQALRNANADSSASPLPAADVNALRARIELLRAKERSLESKIEELERANDLLHKEVQAASVDGTAASAMQENQVPNEIEKDLISARAELADKVAEVERLSSRLADLEVDRERQSITMREVKSRLSETESRLERVQADMARAMHERDEQALRTNEQRRILAQVDKERDIFQADMDAKAEKIVELQSVITRMKEDTRRIEADYLTLREHADALAQSLNEQDREIVSLQKQVEHLSSERDHYASEAQRNAEEARNVGSDLVALTKENQVLNGELSEAIADRDHLRAELGEFERQNQYLEEVARGREQEKDILMSSYRKLISDHEKLEGSVRAANEDGNNMRMEVIMRDKKSQQLQRQLDELSAEAAQVRIDLGSYEKQCSNLTRSLAAAERSIRHLEADKVRLQREVQAARDVALSVERTKDDLQRQATATIVEMERLNGTLRRLESEKEAYESQARAERLKVDRLEHLLAAERTRHAQAAQAQTHSKDGLDEHDKELAQQHAAALSALTRELKDLEQRHRGVLANLADAERAAREAQEAHTAVASRCAALERELADVTAHLHNKEDIIHDILAMRNDATDAKSDVERKVEAELEKTKAQLRKYEVQLEGWRRQDGARVYCTGAE